MIACRAEVTHFIKEGKKCSKGERNARFMEAPKGRAKAERP